MNLGSFKGKIFNPKEIENLYHVGTMDIANKSSESFEGNGLSVSICPKVWMRLARCATSTIWELYKSNLKILDYYSLTENEFNIAREWGLNEGYLEESEVYRYTYFDDEMDCDLTSVYSTFKDACEEACLDNEYENIEEFKQSEEAKFYKIEKEIGYKPTDKLKRLSFVSLDINNAEEINFLLFLEKNTDLDGVYWNEILDELRYSAPRGVIFNSKVNTFSRRIVTLCEDCDVKVAEYDISGTKLCEDCTNERYGEDEFNPETDHYTCAKCGNEYFFGFGKCNCYETIY